MIEKRMQYSARRKYINYEFETDIIKRALMYLGVWTVNKSTFYLSANNN